MEEREEGEKGGGGGNSVGREEGQESGIKM